MAPIADHERDGDLLGVNHELTFKDDLDESAEGVRLQDGVAAQLNYRLAEPSSDAGVLRRGLAPKLSRCLGGASKTPCNIEVDFWCTVCGPKPFHRTLPLDFDPKTKSSAALAFNFVPLAGGANDVMAPAGRHAGVTLQFLQDNKLFDFVHVCVDVGDGPSRCDGENRQTLRASPMQFAANQMVTTGSDAEALGQLNLTERAFAAAAASTGAVNTQVVPAAFGLSHGSTLPDVALKLVEDGDEKPLRLKIIINNSEVQSELAKKLDKDNQRELANAVRKINSAGPEPKNKFLGLYPTRFSNAEHLRTKLQESAYLPLTCAITDEMAFREWTERTLRSRCNRSLNGTIGYANWADPKLKTKAGAEEALKTIGKIFYNYIFFDPNSKAFMSALLALGRERSGSMRPIRVQFGSEWAHVPFQMLLKPGDGSNAFFGLVFDIATDTDQASGDGQVKNVWGAPGTDLKPVIGLFTEFKPVDRVKACKDQGFAEVPLAACLHYQDIASELSKHFKARIPQPAVSAAKFRDGLRTSGRESGLIWFYGHGKTRFDFVKDASGQAKLVSGGPMSEGGRLVFASARDPEGRGFTSLGSAPQEDQLEMPAIRSLEDEDENFGAGYFLRSGPLVVLIACELGATAAPGGTSGVPVTRTFRNLGARGVVASEAEVDSVTADLFGKSLLSELGRAAKGGKASGSLALLRTRQNIYQKQGGNLWPLLFYYAGNHGPFISR